MYQLKSRSKRSSRNRRGASTVEFALVAPLLFFLIFMMFEASRFLMGLHAVTGAARESVRIFAVRGDEEAARAAAVDYLKRSTFNVDEVIVTFEQSASDTADVQNFSCTVEVDYSEVSLIGGPYSLGEGSVIGYGAMMVADGG